jgi:hypothetical protein
VKKYYKGNTMLKRIFPGCARHCSSPSAVFLLLLLASSLCCAGVEFKILCPAAGDTVYFGDTFELRWQIGEPTCLQAAVSTDGGLSSVSIFPPGFIGAIGCEGMSGMWQVATDLPPCDSALLILNGYLPGSFDKIATSEPFFLHSRSTDARSRAVPVIRTQAAERTGYLLFCETVPSRAVAGMIFDLRGRVLAHGASPVALPDVFAGGKYVVKR